MWHLKMDHQLGALDRCVVWAVCVVVFLTGKSCNCQVLALIAVVPSVVGLFLTIGDMVKEREELEAIVAHVMRQTSSFDSD